MEGIHNKNIKALSHYLSPIEVWALSFGCAVGWGAFVMPGTTFLPLSGPLGTAIGMITGAVQGYVAPVIIPLIGDNLITPIVTNVSNGVLIGFLLGFGAMLGDALGSFLKRRLGIGRGKPAPILDQLDFIIVAIILVSPIVEVNWIFIVIAIALTLIIHLIANTGAYILGLKDVWY